jgi:hypothetical protein
MGRSSKRKAKRKQKPKLDPVAKAERDYNQAAVDLLVQTAKCIEQPPPDESVMGHQAHYLRRIDRLTGEARELAERLYHSSALTRYVALRVLGYDPLDIGLIASKAGEQDVAERVVLELESGLEPGKAIVDTRGKVITCLAPGMPVASLKRVSCKVVTALISAYEAEHKLLTLVKEKAVVLEPATQLMTLEKKGWLAPLESLAMLTLAGSSCSALLLHSLNKAFIQTLEAYVSATKSSGLGNDEALRIWFRGTGEVAAYLALLADLGVEPSVRQLRAVFALHDPVLPLVIGACFARWRPLDAEFDAMGPTILEDDVITRFDLFPCHFALMAYFGTLQRMYPRSAGNLSLYDRLDPFMHEFYQYYDQEYQELRRLGMPEEPAVTLLRDLAILARGSKPDWGDDLVDEPGKLPPLRIDDYCLPDGRESLRMIRLLAQQLLFAARAPLATIFLRQADLDRWERKLGPLDRVRNGIFVQPWHSNDDLPLHKAPVRRNDPCPCGSGKKFKKCCIDKRG